MELLISIVQDKERIRFINILDEILEVMKKFGLIDDILVIFGLVLAQLEVMKFKVVENMGDQILYLDQRFVLVVEIRNLLEVIADVREAVDYVVIFISKNNRFLGRVRVKNVSGISVVFIDFFVFFVRDGVIIFDNNDGVIIFDNNLFVVSLFIGEIVAEVGVFIESCSNEIMLVRDEVDRE